MADLQITLGFDVESASVRKVQSEIRRAIRDASPELDLAVNDNFFNDLRSELASLGASISEIRTDPAVVQSLEGFIEENIALEIRQIDPGRRALQRARQEIQDALARIAVTTEIERRRTEGDTSAVGNQLARAAQELGVDINAPLQEALQQRLRAENQYLSSLGKLQLLQAELEASNSSLVSNNKEAAAANEIARNQELRASEQNFRAIERLTRVTDQLTNAEITGAQALKEIGRVKLSDLGPAFEQAKSAQELATLTAEDAVRAEKESNEAKKQEAATIRTLNAQRLQNIRNLARLQQIQLRVTDGSQTYESALREASKITAVNSDPRLATSSRLLVEERDRLVGVLQSNIQAVQEAEAEEREVTAARKARLQQLRQTVRVGQANARSLETLDTVTRSLSREGVNLERALERAQSVRGVGEERGTGREVAERRQQLISTIEGLIREEQLQTRFTQDVRESKKRQAEADAALNESLLALGKEADRNVAVFRKLQRIEENFGDSLVSAESVIKQLRNIDLSTGSSDFTETLRDLRNLLEERATKIRAINRAEQEALKIVDEQDAAGEATAKLQAQQNTALARKLGITLQQVDSSQTILEALGKEANVIVDGTKKTQGAFDFLADKIKAGARRLTGRPQQQREPLRRTELDSRNVTFKNASDVRAFAERLNPEQLARFVDTLGRLSNTAQKAQGNLRRTADSQAKLVDNLKRGVSSASEFGKQVGIAARRLLAWAAPSALIFNTISRLRQAVNEIIAIDKEARRLIFFVNAGNIITQSADAIGELADRVAQTGQNTDNLKELSSIFASTTVELSRLTAVSQTFTVTSEAISKQFTQISGIAKGFGLDIRNVTKALLEVTRVGQAVTGTFRGGTSAFAEAALSLIRVEAGALGAAEAVRGLQAIQAQFFGGRSGAVFQIFAEDLTDAERALQQTAAAAQSVNNAAAVLAATAAGSSASVSELVDATTRLGAAFTNLAGLNFDQTVAILGEAFTATGATTGRLATALRQTVTLISQNAAEIQELTGVNVTNAEGTVRGFEAVVDVLRVIQKEQGNLAATDIALLIADRRNVADILALAAGVDGLSDAYERFADPVERINRVVAAQQQLFLQTEASASSLEGLINNLNTTFTELVNSDGFRELAGNFVTRVTQLVEVFEGLSGVLGAVVSAALPLAQVLGSIFAGRLLQGVFRFGQGFAQSLKTLQQEKTVLAGVRQELQERLRVGQNIRALGQAGLITAEQEQAILQRVVALEAQKLQQNQQLDDVKKKIDALDKQGIKDVQTKNRLLKEQRILLQQIEETDRKIVRQGQFALENAEGRNRARNIGAQRQAIQVAAVVGSVVATGLEKAGAEGLASGLNDGLSGAAAAAAAGAGPWGALAVAIASITTGAFLRSTQRELKKVEAANARAAESGSDTVGALIARIRFLQDASRRAIASGDEEAQAQLRGQAERLEELRAKFGDIEKLARLQLGIGGELNQEQQLLLVGINAQLGVEASIVAETRKGVINRRRAAQLNERAASLLNRQKELQEIINSRTASARTIADAQIEQEKIKKDLQAENLAILPQVVAAQKESARISKLQVELEKQRKREIEEINQQAEVQKTILSALLAIPQSAEGRLNLQVQLDERSFNAAIDQADAAIAALERERRAGGDQAKINAELQKQEDRKQSLRIKRINDIIKQETKTLDAANKATQNQIKAWESAAKAITTAFNRIVTAQSQLAGIFRKIGEANAAIINRVSENLNSALDSSGANIESRLAAIIASANRQLSNARAVFERQSGTLGISFSDTSDIVRSAQRVIEAASSAISKSDEAITKERTGIVTTEAAASRELARQERADFDLKVKQTRREIEARRQLLSEEIRILQERDAAERSLNELRRTQLEDFGRLLIESPEKFRETLDNITSATNFFRGITEINEDSLRTLQRRSEALRGRGGVGQDALRTVLAGIEAAVQTGANDIVGGVGNRQLQQIFSRVQRENIGALADDLQRQQDEANSQTQVQREIEARQRALVALGEFDARIQENILAIEEAAARTAIDQRAAQLRKLEEIKQGGIDRKNELRSAIDTLIAVTTTSIDPATLNQEGASGRIIRALEGLDISGGSRLNVQSFLNDISGQIKGFNDEFAFQATPVEPSPFDQTVIDLNEILNPNLTIPVDELVDAFGTNAARAAFNNTANEVNKFLGSMKKFNNEIKELTNTAKEKREQDIASITTQKAAETAIKLGAQLETGARTNLNRFISAEIAALKNRQGELTTEQRQRLKAGGELTRIEEERLRSGNQLTRAERNRLRELERFSRQRFRNDPTGGRQLARRLLRDEGTQRGIINDFRTTLRDNAQNQNDFIDGVRRLRGEGARGRREINVGAVQRFLTGAGFEGAARRISTRGDAANVLDRFIEISERLAREQGEITSETKRKIVQVLGEELTTGIREITNKTADAALEEQQKFVKRREELEKEFAVKKVDDMQKAADKVIEKRITNPEFQESLQQGFVAGAEQGGVIITDSIGAAFEKLTDFKVGVDVGELTAAITLRTPDAISAQELGQEMRNALSPIIADGAKLNFVANSMGLVVQDLVKKGLIKPIVADIPEAESGPSGPTAIIPIKF